MTGRGHSSDIGGGTPRDWKGNPREGQMIKIDMGRVKRCRERQGAAVQGDREAAERGLETEKEIQGS